MVDVDAASAAPRPGLEVDMAQIRHVMGRNDVQAFGGDPADIRRVLVLFGGEFVRQLVRNLHIVRHVDSENPVILSSTLFVRYLGSENLSMGNRASMTSRGFE